MKYQFNVQARLKESEGGPFSLGAFIETTDLPNIILKGSSIFFPGFRGRVSNAEHYLGVISGEDANPASRLSIEGSLSLQELRDLALQLVGDVSLKRKASPWSQISEAHLFGKEGWSDRMDLYPQFGGWEFFKERPDFDLETHQDALELLRETNHLIKPITYPLVRDLVKHSIGHFLNYKA